MNKKKQIRVRLDAVRDKMLNSLLPIGKVYAKVDNYETIEEIDEYAKLFNNALDRQRLIDVIQDEFLVMLNKLIDDKNTDEENIPELKAIKEVVLECAVLEEQDNPKKYVESLADGLAVCMFFNTLNGNEFKG